MTTLATDRLADLIAANGDRDLTDAEHAEIAELQAAADRRRYLPFSPHPQLMQLTQDQLRRDRQQRELRDGAVNHLRSFIATGLLDFFRAGRDRCVAMGLSVDHIHADRKGAECLIDHLLTWWH